MTHTLTSSILNHGFRKNTALLLLSFFTLSNLSGLLTAVAYDGVGHGGYYYPSSNTYNTPATNHTGTALKKALADSYKTTDTPPDAIAHVSIAENHDRLVQRKLTGPLVLQLHTNHSSLSSHTGDPFVASLPTSSCYKNHCIPAGTRIQGYVEKVLPSRTFHRPGFVDAQISSIQFPDGHVIRYGKRSHGRKIHLIHPNAYTVKRQLMDEVPSLLGATAVVVPLALASTLTAGAIIPLGFAGALIASGIQEGVQHKRGRSSGDFEQKVGRSAMRGTVLPYVGYQASKRSPNVSVTAGQRIAFKPSRSLAKNLYGI
jgi:hypothetical protein